MTDNDKCQRILIVDDNTAIHDDIRKVLCPQSADDKFLDADFMMFGDAPATACFPTTYQIDSVFQGQEALRAVALACAQEKPYSVAIVDMRMPPDWDGLHTIERLWQIDPRLLVIISTAFSDYSWEEMVKHLGLTDRFVLLKKPFDNAEMQQLVAAMVERWHVARLAEINVAELSWMARQNESLLARIDELTARLRGLEGRVAQFNGPYTGRYLIVDPNSMDRVATEFSIREYGLIPVGVPTIADAILELSEGEPFTGVILEMSFPGEETVVLTDLLRKQKFPGAIIAYTSHERPGDRQACMFQGCTDWVPKSCGSEDLLRVLARWTIREASPAAIA